MTKGTTIGHVDDPGELVFGESAGDHPQPRFARALERCPVGRGEFGLPGVYVFDYESVQYVLHHPEIFSSAPEAMYMGQGQPLIPLQCDQPLHTEYRRLLNPLFTPKRSAQMEDAVREIVQALMDAATVDRTGCDFHAEVATPLCSTFFLRLMGLEQNDLAKFMKWRDDLIRPDVEPGDFEGASVIRAEAGREIDAYFQAAVDAARSRPKPGLFGELVDGQVQGRPLTDAEILGMGHLMLVGGLDTVAGALGCLVRFLAEDPERRAALVADPALIPAAIEELLRYESPVAVVPRIVKEPVTLRGVDLQPGDPVTVVLGAANVDDQEFDRPFDVDYDRDPTRHVVFGTGMHLCLGQYLARLQIRVAIEELHRRVPDYRLADGAEPRFTAGIRQPASLPLVWG